MFSHYSASWFVLNHLRTWTSNNVNSVCHSIKVLAALFIIQYIQWFSGEKKRTKYTRFRTYLFTTQHGDDFVKTLFIFPSEKSLRKIGFHLNCRQDTLASVFPHVSLCLCNTHTYTNRANLVCYLITMLIVKNKHTNN